MKAVFVAACVMLGGCDSCSPTCAQLSPSEQWAKCFRADYPARVTWEPDAGFACVCPAASADAATDAGAP